MLKVITNVACEATHETTPNKSIEAGYAIFERPTSLSPHAHEGLYEFLYVQNGQGKIGYNGQTFVANEGDLIIYGPGQPHLEDWRGTLNLPLVFYCKLDGAFSLPRDRALPALAARHPVLPTGGYGAHISRLWWALDHECRSGEAGSRQIIECLVDSLLILIRRLLLDIEPEAEASRKTSIAEQARAFIERNASDKITLDIVASKLHVSAYHLSHEFKREIEVPPMRYLSQVRVHRAELLLRTTVYSVQEIIFQVGFDNVPNFNQLFKRQTGFTPSQYRKHYSEIMADMQMKEES